MSDRGIAWLIRPIGDVAVELLAGELRDDAEHAEVQDLADLRERADPRVEQVGHERQPAPQPQPDHQGREEDRGRPGAGSRGRRAG